MLLELIESLLVDLKHLFVHELIITDDFGHLYEVYQLEVLKQQLLRSLGVASPVQCSVHLCVYLLVLWLPLVGQCGKLLRKR